MVSKFVIIDGNSLLHRAWHALPPLTTKKGLVVNAVYGFTMILLKILKELKPDYLAVAFDTAKPTFRHEEFVPYKAQRKKQPDEFYQQINITKEILESFNLKYLEAPGYEADDIIGTLAHDAEQNKEKISTIIASGDLDNLQLINKNTKVYTLKKGITEIAIYDEKAVKERFGLIPEQLIDFKALRGDPSDNIPGVKGIGEKTAMELIQRFGSLEDLYKKLDKVELKEKTKKLLEEQKKEALLSKKLVTIVKNVPVKFNLEDFVVALKNKEQIIKLFQDLEFKSLLPRVLNILEKTVSKPEQTLVSPLNDKYVLIDNQEKFENFIKNIIEQKEIVIDTETTSFNVLEAKLLGISFSWHEKEAYYLPILADYKFQLEGIKKILADTNVRKIGHNIKYDIEVLEQNGFKLNGLYFDTMLAAYLLSPGKRVYSLDLLVFSEFGYQMKTLEQLAAEATGKKKKNFSIESISLEKLARYSCEDADYTWRLKQRLEPKLKNQDPASAEGYGGQGKLWQLFQTMEVPLIKILAKMETIGIKIDKNILNNLNEQVKKEIKKLEKEIINLAGESFNINSPKQLKIILFEKLKIPTKGLAKTKTGISTAATELEKMKSLHPIIGLISDYRELTKISSTYLEALPELINQKTGRLHTSFNQTIAATGRLSSSEPNLQNIPARTELGKKIREGFVAEKGHSLLSADYSQIELRIIASLADDKKMIGFFRSNQDIHSMTAAEIKNIPLEKVTPDLRRLAKVVNFGIIYGLGRNGLAESASISKEEAGNFIEKYFKVYPQIKNYIEELKDLAQEHGYAETLMGRRRYLPEIHSDIQVLKAEAERAAINMPIQGLAADLIKTAMIELDKKLAPFNNDAKMLLQIHDELIFEVKNEKIKEVGKIIEQVMENPPIKLKVPIKVEIKSGKSWGQLDKIN